VHRILRSSTVSLTAFLFVLTVTADGCKGQSSQQAPPQLHRPSPLRRLPPPQSK
jgi:hypothetical protein